jgi:hypothetical protein
MTLQRRHFQFIADTLRSEKPGRNWDANKRAQWELMVRAFAKACARTNSNFKPDKFLAACDYEETV